MMEEGGSGVESDAMAIVALVALIQDNHHHHRKGEGTLRFAIMDRPKKKHIRNRIGNRAYRVVESVE